MRLGEVLIREGLITAGELERALQRAEQQKIRLGSALVELGFVDVDTVARALSTMHQVPAVLSKHVASVDRAVIALVPKLVATKRRAVPIGWTPTKPPRLVVAFEDPLSTPIEDFAVAAGARIEVGVAPELLVNRLLSRYYGDDEHAVRRRRSAEAPEASFGAAGGEARRAGAHAVASSTSDAALRATARRGERRARASPRFAS